MMKQATSAARILIASDNTGDANQIQRQLRDSFDSVHLSTDADCAVADFEQRTPDVLVLAFDRLEKAQRYYLGLYRLGPTLHQHLHRTVILCGKDEVHAVFELCQKEYFDDYVLYWPYTHDGPRLAMSIWIACREMAAMRSQAPRPLELFTHARHVGELDQIIDRELGDIEVQAAGSRGALAHAEAEISGNFDVFSTRLRLGAGAGWLDVKDTEALEREVRQLQDQQLAMARRATARSVDSMNAWTRKIKNQIAPALAGTRALADKVRAIRPVVMVVEDDALSRKLVDRTLDPRHWETVFASDAAQALGQLRRLRPDVILMDIGLPGIDGLALTRRLKAAPHLADIPVIMLTGDARRETLISSVSVGAAAFIVKPFTRESLVSKLDHVMSR